MEAERTFSHRFPSARRYAQACMQRVRSGLDGRIRAGDLATLDTLSDSDAPRSVLQRDDLTIRTTRIGWAARRP